MHASKQHGVANEKLELYLTPTNELLRLVTATTIRHTGGHLLARPCGSIDQIDTNLDKFIVSYEGPGDDTRIEAGGATKRQRTRNDSHNIRRLSNLHSARKQRRKNSGVCSTSTIEDINEFTIATRITDAQYVE